MIIFSSLMLALSLSKSPSGIVYIPMKAHRKCYVLVNQVDKNPEWQLGIYTYDLNGKLLLMVKGKFMDIYYPWLDSDEIVPVTYQDSYKYNSWNPYHSAEPWERNDY